MREPGSDVVRAEMNRAELWFSCRIAFVETYRAIAAAAGAAIARGFSSEWPGFEVLEVDQELAERAAGLSMARDLRTLDALHLAAALLLPRDDLVIATWDRRLHSAARAENLALLPADLD